MMSLFRTPEKENFNIEEFADLFTCGYEGEKKGCKKYHCVLTRNHMKIGPDILPFDIIYRKDSNLYIIISSKENNYDQKLLKKINSKLKEKYNDYLTTVPYTKRDVWSFICEADNFRYISISPVKNIGEKINSETFSIEDIAENPIQVNTTGQPPLLGKEGIESKNKTDLYDYLVEEATLSFNGTIIEYKNDSITNIDYTKFEDFIPAIKLYEKHVSYP